MIKEYHFAALIYDEEHKALRCAACGKVVAENKIMYKAAGRWVCGKCAPGGESPTECAMGTTLQAAVEQ